MNKNELKNLPALPSLALAAMGLILLITGLCMPWFSDGNGLRLFAEGLPRAEFPVLPAEIFALVAAACTLASLVLMFIPGKETAQRKLFLARCFVSGASMLFSLLALVFAIVYAAVSGIFTHAGAYLSLIGTVVIGVALLMKRISKRRLIQVYAALLTNANIAGFASGKIYTGGTKYACVPGLNCYSCPGAVGACPLGALQNAFANSGTRAPFYVLGILVLFGLLLGRTICGFLCPVGLGQELLYKIKTPKLKKSRFTRVLSYLKYVILVIFVIVIPIMYGMGNNPVPAFCKYICPAGTFGGGVSLLVNPNNAEYFGLLDVGGMLGPLFTWKFALFCAIAAACVFIFRAFCRFICPLGAIYGFFNKIALLGVKLDKNKCTDCGLCQQQCKMDIKHVGDHECINCGECIPACPAKAISWKGSSLFVHANAVDPVPAEEKPLTSLLQPSAEAAPAAEVASVTEKTAPVSQISAESASSAPAAAPAKKRVGKGLVLKIIACVLAFGLMLGGFLYYNVFAKQDDTVKLNVGDECPDFTLTRYGYDESGNYAELKETLSLSGLRGQVVVVNFWGTWCGPCVAELPSFNKAQAEHPEITVVAIQGKADQPVPEFIVNKTDDAGIKWTDYSLTFLQDKVRGDTCETFRKLGGTSYWPYTVIVKADGTVSFKNHGSLSYEKLIEQIEKAKA